MNIVEAYIKYGGGLVIFISGISGCGKTSVAKKISKIFNIDVIEQFNYYKDGYDTKVTLPDETEHINYNSDEAFDWDKLNKDIKQKKKTGVIVTGYALIDDKITTKPDYHIHLYMSKQACMEKRRNYLEKHKDKYPEEYKNINTPTEKLKMNNLIFPYYIDNIKNRSKIDKTINITDMSSSDILNAVWDMLEEEIINQSSVESKYWEHMKTPQEVSEESPEYIPMGTRDEPSESVTEETPEEISESVSDKTSENITEETPESTPQELNNIPPGTRDATEDDESSEDRDLDEDYEKSQTITDGPIEFEGVETLTMDLEDSGDVEEDS